MSLPIRDVLAQIVPPVCQSIPVVVKAPPGAGKTTGIAPVLLKELNAREGQILLVQPRRLAARSAATRLAELAQTKLGDRVGYHVRFDRQCTDATELVVMTTGILLRRLQSDPLLEGVQCVILDEFHERSLELDLAFGMLQRIRTEFRNELRLLVMSATLDPAPIVGFLGDAVGVCSEGRSYPVNIRHMDHRSTVRLEELVAQEIPRALHDSDGDILVFLPGVGEIKRTTDRLHVVAEKHGVEILELYGDLSPAMQDRVFAASTNRKVILSTNIAETSITIPGVTAVIDSGLARVMTFDSKVGLPSLQLQPISQASAEQRAGRAGRLRPGICRRLWTQSNHRSRPERNPPEILRGDLTGALLTLYGWGEADAFDFPWLTPPSQSAVSNANKLLERLDAIEDGRLTPLGKQMLELPLHPRMSRLMVAASEHQVTQPASVLAALLTERNPFRGGQVVGTIRGRTSQSGDRRNSQSNELEGQFASDVNDRVDRLNAFDAGESVTEVQESAARHVLRIAKQLYRMMPGNGDEKECTLPAGDRLTLALLAAYPDRVAKPRHPGSDRALMVGGRGVRLEKSTKVRSADLILCIDVDDGDGEARVRQAAAIDRQWLDPKHLRESIESFFDPTRKAVASRKRTYFLDLLLDETPVACSMDSNTSDLLFREAKRHWQHAFPHHHQPLVSFTQRVHFLIKHGTDNLSVERMDQIIDEVLRHLCASNTSLDQLKNAPWLDHVRGHFTYEELQRIDQEAPAQITVPSGNTFAVDYSDQDHPTLSVKLQELFGWQQTPRLAQGKVRLVLELLGPNGRSQQRTDDLANFWSTTYQQVRKDLRGRYPKHHWPEDPHTAQATRNGLKPRQ